AWGRAMTKLGRRLIKSAREGRAFATRRRVIRIRFANIEPWRPAFPPGVKAYIKMLRAGEQLPPIHVVRQPGRYRWRIEDGYHRAWATKALGYKTIAAYVIAVESRASRLIHSFADAERIVSTNVRSKHRMKE